MKMQTGELDGGALGYRLSKTDGQKSGSLVTGLFHPQIRQILPPRTQRI